MEFYDFPFSWKFQKIPTDDSSMIFQSSTTNQYHNCKKKTAWSSESHLYGWWNHLWAATWLTWRKMKHDNPKKTAQNQSGTKVFGKITPQAVRWQKLNPPARPKSAKLHGCRASCHGTGVAVRNCHSISDLPSKCPQVLIWVCLKVGKPVISWLK